MRATPERDTNTHAGWYGTLYLANTAPGVSSTFTKVSPCRDTNEAYESVSPAHATPTIVTEFLNFACTASTEGASKLQVPQPGAQNHSATGLLASSSPRLKVPPSIVGAENPSTTEPADWGTVVAGESPLPGSPAQDGNTTRLIAAITTDHRPTTRDTSRARA